MSTPYIDKETRAENAAIDAEHTIEEINTTIDTAWAMIEALYSRHDFRLRDTEKLRKELFAEIVRENILDYPDPETAYDNVMHDLSYQEFDWDRI